MIVRQDALQLAEQACRLLCEADPLRAARILARGLRQQSRGGKLAVLRAFVQHLAEHDPGLPQAIAADLTALSKPQGG